MSIEMNPWARSIPAALIRRLGEAADGFRGKSSVYYLVSLDPGPDGSHKVYGPYEKEPLTWPAETTTTSARFGWFGPIETPPDTRTVTLKDFSVTTSSGTIPSVKILGETFDCLFYGTASVEKFAIPYYARMYGGDYVRELHRRFEASALHLMGHLPGTEYQPVDKWGAEPGSTRRFPGIAGVVTGADAEGNAVVEEVLPWDTGRSSPQSR